MLLAGLEPGRDRVRGARRRPRRRLPMMRPTSPSALGVGRAGRRLARAARRAGGAARSPRTWPRTCWSSRSPRRCSRSACPGTRARSGRAAPLAGRGRSRRRSSSSSAVWAWHAPALHHAARASAGCLRRRAGVVPGRRPVLWLAVLGGGPPARLARAGGRRRRAAADLRAHDAARRAARADAASALRARAIRRRGRRRSPISSSAARSCWSSARVYIAAGLWLGRGAGARGARRQEARR